MELIEEKYFIGKFSHVLGEKYAYRTSDIKNRTFDDYEILRLTISEITSFGIQGDLNLWHGTGEDFDWKNYDNNDWGASGYFFEFQSFIKFYTTPTTDPNNSKLVLYTPRDDWSSWKSIVVDEFLYETEVFDESILEDAEKVTELLCILLNEKYKLIHVSKYFLGKYLGNGDMEIID
jgi:hypothetical protein